MAITSLFQTANSIINAASAGQLAVGKNIAGMRDPNYHRVNTTLIANRNGVTARFTRAYNQYTERSFIDQASSQHRWTTQNELIKNIQSLFNESGDRQGIGKTLTKLFASWSGLSTNPSNVGSKVEVVEVGKTLSQLLQTTQASITQSQRDSISKIQSSVQKVNSILDEIASLNKLITTSQGTDSTLLDKRDALTRELSQYIDVNLVNSDFDNFTLTTKSGYTLVSGSNAYSLELHSNAVLPTLNTTSTYTGTVHFSGISNYEYTVEMVTGGPIGTAEFRVSIDGGKTWITNPANGSTRFTTTGDANNPIKVGDLELWFDTGAGDLVAGDSFTVVPKLGLFWKSTTSALVNVTPQTIDGVENPSRVTGGSLGGLFSFHDSNAGIYNNQLNAFTKEVIWAINRIYSQGASSTTSNVAGTQAVKNTTASLGTSQAGLPYRDRLQNGTFIIYETNATGTLVAHTITFDPAQDSLEELRDKITAVSQNITATISADGKLDISATQPNHFAFGEDNTGILAALGINTFFTGSSAETIGVNPALIRNPSLVHTGKVINGAITIGDNSIALSIAGLQNQSIDITDAFNNVTKSTLFEYYTGIAAQVGADVDATGFQSDYHKAQAGFWYAKGQAEYGVSEDEELMFSMQLENLYIAGTKLMDTARTMLESLLTIV